MKLLVSAGADVTARSKNGRTALSWACRSRGENATEAQQAEVARTLIAKGADANEPDSDGHTPLSWAARSGNARLVKVLVREGGAQINLRCGGDQGRATTPLVQAVRAGHAGAARALLRLGADAGARTGGGDDDGGGGSTTTALHEAARTGRQDLVRLLVEKGGAGVGAADGRGATAMDVAAEKGHKGVRDYLKKRAEKE